MTEQLDLASLIARFLELEQRQNVVSKYAVGVKRQLDQLSQQFNTRSELQQLEDFQKTLAQLSEQVLSLQQRLEASNNPEATEIVSVVDKNINDSVNADIENATIKQENNREAVIPTQSTESVVNISDNSVNSSADATEAIQDEETVLKTEESATGLKDIEFYAERMMWLLNRIYAVEERNSADNIEIPVTAEEFWEQSKVQKDFSGVNLAEVDLSEKTIPFNINLSQANLQKANLDAASLEGVNLKSANLKGAILRKAKLSLDISKKQTQ